MNNLSNMLWVEGRKALRSNVPLFTGLGSMFAPLGIAFLLFVSRNPEVSRKLGLISTKASILADSAASWPTYFGMFIQLMAMGGMILAVLILSWIFGREFTDGTVKDLLAVPVQRANIILAKFIVASVWFALLAIVMYALGLGTGALIQLPDGSASVLVDSSLRAATSACLAVAVMLPFAFLASLGRGYLLPIGVMILTLIAANLMVVIGYGEYFPWSIVALFSQGKEALPAVSYLIVALTSLAGIAATYLWWKYADQNR